MCPNYVENAVGDLTSADQRLPRLHRDWLIPNDINDIDIIDQKSIVQNMVRVNWKEKDLIQTQGGDQPIVHLLNLTWGHQLYDGSGGFLIIV